MDRWAVLERVCSGGLRQSEAAKILGLSVRQVRRLLVRTALVGMEGLLSRSRGGNRAMDPALKDHVLSLMTTQYHDFDPTLAAEKLFSLHSDRHSIFLTTRNVDGYYEKTQFSRSMEALDTETVCAHSPQQRAS